MPLIPSDGPNIGLSRRMSLLLAGVLLVLGVAVLAVSRDIWGALALGGAGLLIGAYGFLLGEGGTDIGEHGERLALAVGFVGGIAAFIAALKIFL